MSAEDMLDADLDGWRDLSDSEVRSRLIHRGVDPERAFELVNDRDDDRTARTIDRYLGGRR